MAHTFGAAVLVPFPFSDRSAAKKRPAVIEQSLVVHTLGALSVADTCTLREAVMQSIY